MKERIATSDKHDRIRFAPSAIQQEAGTTYESQNVPRLGGIDDCPGPSGSSSP
ncbi:MAG: hypothetical protein KF688_15870 [Pirellulales bacterium]|nr:hypothetical protein [Pirellulales bacterium]